MKPHMSEGLEIVLSSGGSSDLGPEKHKGMGQLEQIICRLDAIEKKLNMKSKGEEEDVEESEDNYDSVMYG